MAKTKKTKADGVNKSQAVREELAKSEDSSPSVIAAALAKRNISVSPAFVSNIKTAMKKKAGAGGTPAKRGRRPGSVNKPKKTADVSLTPNHDLILKAVDLVSAVGAVEAKRLIDVADKLVQHVAKMK